MKLHYAPPSPYVRKVLVSAIELGLDDRIERLQRAVTPLKPEQALNQDNPIGKIPALVLDDGTALFDSRVICEYLDSLSGDRQLFPDAGAARWAALRRQALADGILDAAVNGRYETFLRPEEKRWPDWLNGQKAKMFRSVDALEKEAPQLAETLDIGTITIGCALAYLDFRYADDPWRDSRPAIASWFEKFAQRPSMKQTAPE